MMPTRVGVGKRRVVILLMKASALAGVLLWIALLPQSGAKMLKKVGRPNAVA